jgi:hypothetical protein
MRTAGCCCRTCCGGSSVDDLGPAFSVHPGERGLHLGEPLGRVGLPVRDLADYAQGLAAAVRLGRVAGKALVGEVGIVLERAGRVDDIDPLAALTFRQLAPPDRRVERAREVNPRQLAVRVVGSEAGREQVARREVGAGAVLEGAGGGGGVGHWFGFQLIFDERRAYQPQDDEKVYSTRKGISHQLSLSLHA